MMVRGFFACVALVSFMQVSVLVAAPLSNPVVWLDAQDIDNDGNAGNNPTLGTPVANWSDKANGAGVQQGAQNATQANGAIQPTYVPNFQNGQAAIQFSGDRLDTPSFGLGAFTIFSAFNGGTGSTLVYERGPNVNSSQGEYMATSNGSTIAVRRTGSSNTQKNYVANWTTSPTLLTAAHTYNGTHASHLLYVNGNAVALTDASASLTGNPGLAVVNAPMYIGSRFGQVAPMTGHFSEMLVYDSALNQASIRIVNNYLSSKYDATMAGLNDRYSYDAPGIDYDFDVFGIGAEADGVLSTNSFGTGLTLSEANSSLSTGDYLLAGRTLTAPAGVVSSDLAGTSANERLGRVWAIEKTGMLDATITFNLADLDSGWTGGEDFTLLFRSGISGNFTELSALKSVLGTNVSFTLLDNDLANGYYTLGVVPIPEPNSLLLSVGMLGLLVRSRRRNPSV